MDVRTPLIVTGENVEGLRRHHPEADSSHPQRPFQRLAWAASEVSSIDCTLSELPGWLFGGLAIGWAGWLFGGLVIG